MALLPKEIKLTWHAQERLAERNDTNKIYNDEDLMKSSCKWYGKSDLIENSSLYRHSMYVCRKSNQMDYLTDGNIEVIYNKNTGIALTILKVKEKFQPFMQYVKSN